MKILEEQGSAASILEPDISYERMDFLVDFWGLLLDGKVPAEKKELILAARYSDVGTLNDYTVYVLIEVFNLTGV